MPLVEHVHNRHHIHSSAVAVQCVNVIVKGDKADIVGGKNVVDVLPDLNVVSSETAQVFYDNQIDYATLYIDLYEVEKETDTSEPGIGERMKRGLSDTFENIGEGLQNFAVGFVSALPYIVILAIVVVVVVVICRRIYKKHRKMM